jgi:hypothetical protein
MTLMSDDEHLLLHTTHDYCQAQKKPLYDLIFGHELSTFSDMFLIGSKFAATRGVDTSVLQLMLSLKYLFVGLHIELYVQL